MKDEIICFCLSIIEFIIIAGNINMYITTGEVFNLHVACALIPVAIVLLYIFLKEL